MKSIYIYIYYCTNNKFDTWTLRVPDFSEVCTLQPLGWLPQGNPTSESQVRGCNRSSGMLMHHSSPLSGFWLAVISRWFIPFYVSRWWDLCTTTPGECKGGWLFYYWRWDFQEHIPCIYISQDFWWAITEILPMELMRTQNQVPSSRIIPQHRFFCSKNWKSFGRGQTLGTRRSPFNSATFFFWYGIFVLFCLFFVPTEICSNCFFSQPKDLPEKISKTFLPSRLV